MCRKCVERVLKMFCFLLLSVLLSASDGRSQLTSQLASVVEWPGPSKALDAQAIHLPSLFLTSNGREIHSFTR